MLKLAAITATCAIAGGLFYFRDHASARSNLIVEYGSQGVERLSYRGVVLEDLEKHPSDAFHIWHMKMTSLDGRPRADGQYGWGENYTSRSWDNSAHAWNYRFVWGTIHVRFLASGDRLDMIVTEHNDPRSGVILNGATIYPLVLHFPRTPAGFSGQASLAFNNEAPGVTLADYGIGKVSSVVLDVARPLYTGFVVDAQPNAYTPIMSGTPLDQMAAFQPPFDRPLAPGETDIFTVSLRFAPPDEDAAHLAADVYANWAKSWPQQIRWPDRRMIGTIYLASSPPSGDVNRSGGFPSNPRRYFNDGDATDFDLRTPSGLSQFQSRILRQAHESAEVLSRLNAQGAITWDIEGEEYPQETSYICSPDQIASIAPEMESVITDRTSPYVGMKLDDAWFKTLRDAGFRVGVCVRPQRFTLVAGIARQVSLPDDQVAAELIRKMRYAHDRWGATLFYLDSTVRENGGTLDASIFQKAAAALPDSLLIPEESTAKSYAYAAPFKSFLFHGDHGTDESIYRFYPNAFSVNLVNDVAPDKLSAARMELTKSVRHGDILMAHAGYWHTNNTTLVEVYRDAGVK